MLKRGHAYERIYGRLLQGPATNIELKKLWPVFRMLLVKQRLKKEGVYQLKVTRVNHSEWRYQLIALKKLTQIRRRDLIAARCRFRERRFRTKVLCY